MLLFYNFDYRLQTTQRLKELSQRMQPMSRLEPLGNKTHSPRTLKISSVITATMSINVQYKGCEKF